jgi:plastocyanin
MRPNPLPAGRLKRFETVATDELFPPRQPGQSQQMRVVPQPVGSGERLGLVLPAELVLACVTPVIANACVKLTQRRLTRFAVSTLGIRVQARVCRRARNRGGVNGFNSRPVSVKTEGSRKGAEAGSGIWVRKSGCYDSSDTNARKDRMTMRNRSTLTRASLAGLVGTLAVVAGAMLPVARAADATGTFKGTVTLDGAAPALKPLYKKGDANVKDSAICVADSDLPNEDIVFDAGTKGVANVFVYLQKAPAGYKAPAVPADPIVLDQKACRFFPRAAVVRVGQEVSVLNDDDCLHNTHVTSISYQFNEAIRAKDRKGLKYKFPKALKTPAPVTCDLHPWMKAFQLAVDHPFATVTDEKGNFEITGLPAGDYEFTVWHEATGYVERSLKVSIKAGAETKNAIKIPASKIKSK